MLERVSGHTLVQPELNSMSLGHAGLHMALHQTRARLESSYMEQDESIACDIIYKIDTFEL